MCITTSDSLRLITYTNVSQATVPTATVKYSDIITTTSISIQSSFKTETATHTVMYSYSSPIIPNSRVTSITSAVFSAPSITHTPPFHTTAVPSTEIASASSPTSLSSTATTVIPGLTSSVSSFTLYSPTIPASSTSTPSSGCIGVPGCIFGDDIISTIELAIDNTRQCEEDCAATTSCLSYQYGYPSAGGLWNCNLLNDTAINVWDQEGTEGDEDYCDQYIIYDVPCF